MFFFDTAADTNFSTNDGSMVVDNYNSPLLIHNGFSTFIFHLSKYKSCKFKKFMMFLHLKIYMYELNIYSTNLLDALNDR